MRSRDALLATRIDPYEMHVERGKVVEFARAVLADDPVHTDVDAARAAGHPDLVAPPTFSAVTGHWSPPRDVLGLDLRRVLAGGNEWEYVRPVHAGEVLTVHTRVSDVTHKTGSRGGMTLMVLESEFRGTDGEPCLVNRSTVIELDQAPAEREGES